MQDEAELRKLIKQVSDMAKIKVSESTVNDIVRAVKASGMNMIEYGIYNKNDD